LHHALYSRRTLFSRLDERAKGYSWVCDDQLQHAVEFAIVKVEAGFAEVVEVCEDPLYTGYGVGVPGDMDGIGAEVDRDVESVFEETEVFVVGPIEGLDAGGNFQGFFDQVVC
jgi:hypothetical protein